MPNNMERARQTTTIVGAYLQSNSLPAADLARFIEQVHGALRSVVDAPAAAVEPTTRRTPAEIRKSISRDSLVSFEDGRSYKVLKRHLTLLGLTPDQYRQKWGLPSDYPMTAPGYSALRSQVAKDRGLGRK